MNITDGFDRFVHDNPDHPALIQGTEIVTFFALNQRVCQRVEFYRKRGLKSGMRILVFVPMSIALYEILIALFRMNCTVVFLDAWADSQRMNHALKLAECHAFIGIAKSFLLLFKSGELRRVPLKIWSLHRGCEIGEPPQIPGGLALLTFTTGSTGIPKAVVRTHDDLRNQSFVLTRALALPPDTLDMATLPIFALNNLSNGLTTLIPRFDMRTPGQVDGRKLLAEAECRRVTNTVCSPAFLKCLTDAAKPGRLPTLRRIFTGGAPVFPAFAQSVLKTFPHVRCTAVYGSSEAEPIAEIDFETLAQTDISSGIPAGFPVPEIKVKLLPLNGSETVGEIAVSGPHVLRHYYRNPEAEAETKINVDDALFHRTGDVGRFGLNGELYLLGRVKTAVQNAEGKWVFPMIWEALFAQLPGIRAGTVLVIRGEPVAFLESDWTKTKVQSLLKENGADFGRICVLKKLPRDPRHQSKIDGENLKAQFNAIGSFEHGV